VDGGGTKTAALLVDETGQVLGSGSSGGACYHVVGLEQTFASVKEASEAALAGRAPDVICYSMSAADMPHDFAQLRGAFDEFGFSCPWVIHNDVMGVFRAGSRFPYGVGVVCGTGFNAGGISKTGSEFRLPSLGLVTGDRAGGGYLSTLALGAAFRAWDGRGEATMLSQAILQALDALDFETLAERYVRHELSRGQINALAPLVFEASEMGDAVAQALIRDQGIELGTAANAILRKLDLAGEDCDVVLGGSVWYGKGDLLMSTVNDVIHGFAPKAVIRRLDVPPVVGAVLLAADSIGADVKEHFAETLRATLPEPMRVPWVI